MSENKQSKKFRRRQFWVNKDFQRRMIGQFLFVMVGSIVLSHLFTLGFLKIREMMGVAQEDMIYLSNALTETVAFTKTVEVLWLPLLISSLVGSLVILVFGLFYSHRLAGPLFNLKRTMGKIAKGEWHVRVGIRKNDEFQDVKESLNDLVLSLQGRMDKLNTVLEDMPVKHREKIAEVFELVKEK